MKHVEVIVGSRVPIGWIAGVDSEVANQNQRNILGVFFSIILRCHFIFANRKCICICFFFLFLFFFFVNLSSLNYHFIYLFLSSIGTEFDGQKRQKMNFSTDTYSFSFTVDLAATSSWPEVLTRKECKKKKKNRSA